MRICARCKQDKDLDQFTKSNPWYCRQCKTDMAKAWRHRKRAEYLAAHPEEIPTEKLCKRCNTVKPLDEFYTLKGRWKYYFCKSCSSQIAATRRELKAKLGELAYERLQYRCNKHGAKADWYLETLKTQNGTCAICRTEETYPVKRGGKIRMLAIDHSHSTNQLRGLLCFRCNTALHQLEKHGLGWAEAAVKYLEKYKET